MSDQFNDRFGGQTLKPTEVSFKAFVLTADLYLDWPHLATTEDYVAGIMEVMADAAGRKITLPDAQEVSLGQTFIVRNVGAYDVGINLYDGTGLYLVRPGQAVFFYLKEGEDSNGVWDAFLLGVGTGILDLTAAAGNGLVVINNRLMTSELIVGLNTDFTLDPVNGRARFYVWVGGTGTVTLPRAVDAGTFSTEFRNQGSGAMTFVCAPNETIDGSASLVLQVGESCKLHAGNYSNNWFTVGRGRATQFAFSQLRKEVTGGVVGLTLTEAANVVQTYVGTLGANADIVLPAVVQVYYVSNQTQGPYNLRIRNPGEGGKTVSIPVGQNAVLFSDGTNVINASTTVAGIANLLMDGGSVVNPSLGIGSATSGLYSPGSGEVGVTVNGKIRLQIGDGTSTAWGQAFIIDSTQQGTDANLIVSGPAGKTRYMSLFSGNKPRWAWLADAAGEIGANAGSDLQLARYADDGSYLGPSMFASRKTGGITIPTLFVTDLNVDTVHDPYEVGSIRMFVGEAIERKNYHLLDGRLLNRAGYPELWLYAQRSGLVSEADWGTLYFGRFSSGDGISTFRLPDVRAMFLRSLNAGRADEGIDPRRPWGHYQDQALMSHGHSLNDPGHGHEANAVYGGEHGHSITDTGHLHPNGVVPGGGVSYAGVGGNNAPVYQNTGISGTGISINMAGGHGHGVQVVGSYTGISMNNTGGTDLHPRNIGYPVYVRYV